MEQHYRDLPCPFCGCGAMYQADDEAAVYKWLAQADLVKLAIGRAEQLATDDFAKRFLIAYTNALFGVYQPTVAETITATRYALSRAIGSVLYDITMRENRPKAPYA